jgi:glycosyltransferase involved in cell wall biosynthesis
MKILFITTMAGAPWGGSEELWVKSALYAKEQGHEVIVSVYHWQPLHSKLIALKNKGVKIDLRKKIYYGSSTFHRIKGFFIKKIFSGYNIIKLRKYEPDAIVISQGTIYECMYPEFLKLVNTTKSKLIIITQANSEYDTLPPHCFEVGREIFKKANHLFFVSQRNLVVAERQLAMKFLNASVISNPANLNNYEICNWNNSNILHMAFAGRLNSTVKGLGVLLQILGSKTWLDRDWVLNFYGEGDDEDYLKKLVDLYNLQHKVFFRGFVKDVQSVWKENHILLMPSTLEGTPLTLIEAMLCGRTAVVSDVGGNAELIVEGENGFVAEAPSLYSFGMALDRMWNKKAELENIGILACSSVKQKINLESYKEIIERIL